MIKAYAFDLFERDFLSQEKHKHLLITELDKSAFSKEKRAQVVLYEDNERVIEKLKKNYKISNVFDSFFKNFDVIALSSEFFYVLNKLGVEFEETVMGDLTIESSFLSNSWACPIKLWRN